MSNGGEGPGYSWDQTLKDVTVNVTIPDGLRSRDLDIQIRTNRISVAVRGRDPIVEGTLYKTIKPDDSLWTKDGSVVTLELVKVNGMEWWKSVIEGHEEIDTKKIEPENSKLSDLDSETRSVVEKMMAAWKMR